MTDTERIIVMLIISFGAIAALLVVCFTLLFRWLAEIEKKLDALAAKKEK